MKFGILGLGSIGKRHANNLHSLGYTASAYDPALGSPASARIEVIKLSDAVIIASPTMCHYQDIIDCLSFNKPIFVEKPIVGTWGHLNKIRNVIKDEIMMVGYNLRFHACVKQAREWLEQGRIGKPLWANFTCAQFNSKPDYLRDGVVLNWSHEIDLALYLLGHADFQAAAISPKNDIADILLTHDGGCMTTIHLDYLTIPENRFFTIYGEKGKISVSLPSRNAILSFPDKDQSQWLSGKGSYDTDYMNEMQAFIDMIENKPHLGCHRTEAIRVAEICFQALGVTQ